MQKYFNFSTNWNNKLSCKAFTTIRLTDKCEIGDEIHVSLKKERLPDLYLVKDRRCIKLDDINEFVAYLDTGYSEAECKKMLMTMSKNKNVNWETQPVFLYLLVKIKK